MATRDERGQGQAAAGGGSAARGQGQAAASGSDGAARW